MSFFARCAIILTVLAGSLAHLGSARAAAPYQGIYVIVDPYTAATVADLKIAAQTPCVPGTPQTASPFCGAANGILLRIPWCDFQLYHVNGPQGPYPSCHYNVEYSNGVGSIGVQNFNTDEISPCSGSYDTCTGSSSSILGSTLRVIQQIDNQRAAAGLPPLQLSVGMFAGAGTPQTLLDEVGYVDINYNQTPNSPPTQVCNRFPLAWKPQFTNAYLKAYDQLLGYINAQSPPGTIVMVKPANITGADLEVQMSGQLTAAASPVDPGPGGPGPALNCSQTIPTAATWLSAYNAAPNAGQNFSEANEAAFGTAVGHIWGTMQNLGLGNAILSMATTGTNDFANVDCGNNGAGACAVKTGLQGDFSIYYFQKYVIDLFNGGLAYSSAASGYAGVRTDTFALAPSQLAINWTGLATTPLASSQQIGCSLNNTNPADAPIEQMNSTNVQVLGVGTVVGWQTYVSQGGLCAAGTYGQTLSNGIADGGLYIEIEDDAAFTDIAACSPYLETALTQILALSPPQQCTY
jgi:hypothetical protein